MVDPFAALGCFFPIMRGSDGMDPPREGAALDRAAVIDGTLIVFEEDAGIGSGSVEKSGLSVDEADEALRELFRRELKVV